jgi:hypothetical protein
MAACPRLVSCVALHLSRAHRDFIFILQKPHSAPPSKIKMKLSICLMIVAAIASIGVVASPQPDDQALDTSSPRLPVIATHPDSVSYAESESPRMAGQVQNNEPDFNGDSEGDVQDGEIDPNAPTDPACHIQRDYCNYLESDCCPKCMDDDQSLYTHDQSCKISGCVNHL